VVGLRLETHRTIKEEKPVVNPDESEEQPWNSHSDGLKRRPRE